MSKTTLEVGLEKLAELEEFESANPLKIKRKMGMWLDEMDAYPDSPIDPEWAKRVLAEEAETMRNGAPSFSESVAMMLGEEE